MSNKASLQNQLQNIRASDPKESNEVLNARLEDVYCSITVDNHRLITVIRFVAKNYTHPWKSFANKLRLVVHARKILFVAWVAWINQIGPVWVCGRHRWSNWVLIWRARAPSIFKKTKKDLVDQALISHLYPAKSTILKLGPV